MKNSSPGKINNQGLFLFNLALSTLNIEQIFWKQIPLLQITPSASKSTNAHRLSHEIHDQPDVATVCYVEDSSLSIKKSSSPQLIYQRIHLMRSNFFFRGFLQDSLYIHLSENFRFLSSDTFDKSD